MRQKMEGESDVVADKQKKVVLAIDDDTGVITLFKRYLEHDRLPGDRRDAVAASAGDGAAAGARPDGDHARRG